MRAIRPTDAVLTGAGCVTALGRTLAETHTALAAGSNGVHAVGDAAPAMDQAAVLEAPFLRVDVPDELEAQIKFLNGAGELAVEACAEAMLESALMSAPYEDTRRGLYLSQMDSYDWSCPEFHNAMRGATDDLAGDVDPVELNASAKRRVKPFFMLESLKNNAFSFLATWFGLRGANTSVAGFSGPTWTCLDMAVRSLARGSLDAAVVVGAARPTSGVARAELQANAVPTAAGDGAGALVFERRADAVARGIAGRAIVLGSGAATIAPPEGSWAPPTAALLAAARVTLAEAEVGPGELGGVIAPGLGESGLLEALEELPATAGVPLRSIKPHTGHLALASDAVEVALAAASLAEGDGAPVLVLTAGLLGQAGAVVLARA